MKATRNQDQIVITEATGEARRYLACSGWPFSYYARGYVIPEWAYWGLPSKYRPATIQGQGAPCIAERRCNPLDLLLLPPELTLFPFQKPLALNLTTGRYGLWADAGVGKTVTTLAAYRMLRAKGLVRGMIVVGPENGRHVWCGPRSESARWLNEPGHYLESGGKQEPPAEGIIYTTAAKVFLSPYHTWLFDRLKTGQFILAIDEAHCCSGSLTQRFATLESWAKYCPWVWLLSATPTANYPDSFWALYRLLTGSNVSLDAWVQWFRATKETGSKSKWKVDRLKALGGYLAYCTKRVKKKDVAPQLPPVTEQIFRIPLQGKQRAWYAGLINDLRDSEGELGSQVHAGTKNWQHKLQYLVSMASHPLIGGYEGWGEGDIAKLDMLRTLLQSIGRQKALIWSWHPGVLDWLAQVIGPEKCVVYHGSISKSQKDAAVRRFQEDASVQYFLGNPSAAGTSLNLGAGTVRIFWDLGWSYVQYHQACERNNRITRTLPVTSYVLIAENTVEEMMWTAIQRKEELSGHIVSESRTKTYEKEVSNLWETS